MLTKDDLSAIQKMFDSLKGETDARFDIVDKKFDGINKKFVGMDKRFDNLSDNLHKSTNDLVELITNGFNLTEKRIERIEEKVFGTN